MSRHAFWRALSDLAVIGAAIALVVVRPLRLGLDLRGGTQIVLEAHETETQQGNADDCETYQCSLDARHVCPKLSHDN